MEKGYFVKYVCLFLSFLFINKEVSSMNEKENLKITYLKKNSRTDTINFSQDQLLALMKHVKPLNNFKTPIFGFDEKTDVLNRDKKNDRAYSKKKNKKM